MIKIFFQICHTEHSLELKGQIRANLRLLVCRSNSQQCVLVSAGAAPQEAGWFQISPSPTCLITHCVCYIPGYKYCGSLNLWGEDHRHLLGMFCKKRVIQLCPTPGLCVINNKPAVGSSATRVSLGGCPISHGKGGHPRPHVEKRELKID